MKKKRARSYHHGDLKTAMMEAALALVRSKGPRGFSLNEASRTAGVSVSAPYNHFKDKNALLVEIILLGNRTLESELRDAACCAAKPKEQLIAVFLGYIRFAKLHPDLFAVMFQSGIDKTPYPAVHASAAAAFGVAVELATQIEGAPARAQELAFAIWTMAHGFATLAAEGALARVNGEDANSFAELLVRRLLG